jgi:hypothetical protein
VDAVDGHRVAEADVLERRVDPQSGNRRSDAG